MDRRWYLVLFGPFGGLVSGGRRSAARRALVERFAEGDLTSLPTEEDDPELGDAISEGSTALCEGSGGGVRIPPIRGFAPSSSRGISLDWASGRSAVCPVCQFTTKQARVAAQASERGFGYRLLAVGKLDGGKSKAYRTPTRIEEDAFARGDLGALPRWTDEMRWVDRALARKKGLSF